MHKIKFRIISFLLAIAINAKIAKINNSFLNSFYLVRDILRYNIFFASVFNI